MHNPLAGISLMILAIVLVYGPILLWILLYERRQERIGRHHDHLIPATPRTARR